MDYCTAMTTPYAFGGTIRLIESGIAKRVIDRQYADGCDCRNSTAARRPWHRDRHPCAAAARTIVELFRWHATRELHPMLGHVTCRDRASVATRPGHASRNGHPAATCRARARKVSSFADLDLSRI
jgi:hypothetical protein